jgi:fructose transport system permease protein
MTAEATTTTHSAAEEFARRRQSPLQRLQHLLHAHPAISPAAVLLLAVLVFGLINSNFIQPRNLSLVLQQFAIVGLLAVGQTLVVLTAGIDLSVGAVCILATMVTAKLAAEQGVPGFLSLLIGIALGTGAGFLNGVLVTRLNLPPFIVTLGTLSIFTALGLLYSGGASIDGQRLPGIINWAGNPVKLGPLNLTTGVLLVLLVYILMGFALSQTIWGRHVYAVGNDIEAARLSGISVNRVLVSVYTVAGAIFGLGAWVLIGRAGAASPNSLTDANLESITAVVIGGTSLFGGRGAVLGTLLGALIVRVFSSGLSLARVDNQWRVFAIGVLVVAAVAVDQWIRKVRA